MLNDIRLLRFILLSFFLSISSIKNGFGQDFIFASLEGVPISTTGWNMQGAAKRGSTAGNPANSEIILTEAINTQSGAIFYNTPINLSLCKKWIAEFEFRIFEGTIADGLAFCYLDVPPSGFVAGGGVGIPASANGLKIVLDTWQNCGAERVPKLQIRWGSGYDECNGQPTRNNNDGQLSFIRSNVYNKCLIEYNEGVIKVSLNGVEYLTANQNFNFTGYFGFTASTGGYNDKHSIRNVKIYTEMPPSQAGSDVEFCGGSSARLGGGGTTGYTYRWSPATGLSSATVSNPFVGLSNFAEKDSVYQYIVETAFSDKPGCTSRDSVLVKVLAKPVPAFVQDSACLPGGTVTFENISRHLGVLSNDLEYAWNFGDPGSGASNISTIANPSHFYNSIGPYKVQLAAQTTKGCVDTLEVNIKPLVEKPVANFTFSFSGCLTDSARFISNGTAAFPDSVSGFLWYFDQTNIAAAKTMAYKFATPGIKQVKHLVISSRGCLSDTVTQSLVVNPNPLASFILTGPFCQNKELALSSTSTTQVGTITSWIWIMDNGLVFDRDDGAPFTYAYPATGTYTIKLVVTTNSGCRSDTASQTITVGYIPVTSFELPDVCLNDAFAAFNNTSAIEDGNAGQLTWLWNYGDPNANAGNPNAGTPLNGLHKYTATGNYTVKLVATTINGCKDSILQTLTVNGDKPVAAFSFENTGNLCSNLPVEIRNLSTVNFGKITRVVVYWNDGINNLDSTEDWNPIPDKIYAKQYPVFSTPASRQVTIRFVAYSGGICVHETFKVFTLYSNPVANFQTTPTNGCLGSPFQFTDQTISSGNNLAGWNWFFGNGSTSNLQNPIQEYTTEGNFSVSLYVTTAAGCSSDTISKQVIVYPIPVVNAGSDLIVLQGGQVTLRGEASGSSGYAYLWEPATWLSDPNVAQPVSRAEGDITYKLTVTADGGCSASDEVFIKLLLKPIIPNAFSPNGDGINETWVIRYLDSYPGATVQVLDRYGKRVFMSTGYNNPWNGTLGGSPVPAGVYYYILTPKNGLQPITGSVTVIR